MSKCVEGTRVGKTLGSKIKGPLVLWRVALISCVVSQLSNNVFSYISRGMRFGYALMIKMHLVLFVRMLIRLVH